MIKLPNDVCRCVNDGCAMRQTCLRWLNRENLGIRTPIAMFKPDSDGVCKDQIRTRAEDESARA